MTEKNQGAAEWLRRIIDQYEAKVGPLCGDMAELFGLCCDDFYTCPECRVKMMRVIADRIDAERALPEGTEWPRFEDGELVKVGDEVEYGGKALEVDAICFDREEWSMALRRNLDISRMSGSYDERVKRPTPKVLGADGAPIGVGDTVYFADGDGSALIVERIDANGGEPAVDLVYAGERTRYHSANPENLTHERPDSWERIEKDAAKPVCEYAGAQKSTADPDRYSCIDCLYDDLGFHTDAECNERMRLDLVRRAKALAKAGEQA